MWLLVCAWVIWERAVRSLHKQKGDNTVGGALKADGALADWHPQARCKGPRERPANSKSVDAASWSKCLQMPGVMLAPKQDDAQGGPDRLPLSSRDS